jgi:hypothetical protein
VIKLILAAEVCLDIFNGLLQCPYFGGFTVKVQYWFRTQFLFLGGGICLPSVYAHNYFGVLYLEIWVKGSSEKLSYSTLL